MNIQQALFKVLNCTSMLLNKVHMRVCGMQYAAKPADLT